MTSINIGSTVPDFEVPSTGNKIIKLTEYLGKYLILYFYPKDNTSGCIQEGQGFRDLMEKLEALNAVILGVSRDTVRSHEGFKSKQQLPFDLLSDQDEKLCRAFAVIKTKNMYGRQVQGIERSTFLVGPDGRLVHEWRKVNVKIHSAEVLQALNKLKGN